MSSENLNTIENKEPMSRYTAAEILRELAEVGEYGGNPKVDPFDVGKSLSRILSNNGMPDEYNLELLIKGFKAVGFEEER